MKRKIIVCCSLFFIAVLGYSQDTGVLKKDYEKDTLKGRHFGNYVKPKDGIKVTNPESGIDRDPTFVKCRNIKSAEGRRNCFSRIFYDHLRKRIRHSRSLVGKTPIEMIIQFTISRTGEIKDIQFLKSNDESGKYEKEMIRVIKKLPPLEPGLKNGSPADIPFSFPIKFG